MFIVLAIFSFAATAVAQSASVTIPTTRLAASNIISTAQPASTASVPIAIWTPHDIGDSWQCATKNITNYLKPPMPTGILLDAYHKHADSIYEECEKTISQPFTAYPPCPSVAKASWCAVRIKDQECCRRTLS